MFHLVTGARFWGETGRERVFASARNLYGIICFPMHARAAATKCYNLIQNKKFINPKCLHAPYPQTCCLVSEIIAWTCRVQCYAVKRLCESAVGGM